MNHFLLCFFFATNNRNLSAFSVPYLPTFSVSWTACASAAVWWRQWNRKQKITRRHRNFNMALVYRYDKFMTYCLWAFLSPPPLSCLSSSSRSLALLGFLFSPLSHSLLSFSSLNDNTNYSIPHYTHYKQDLRSSGGIPVPRKSQGISTNISIHTRTQSTNIYKSNSNSSNNNNNSSLLSSTVSPPMGGMMRPMRLGSMGRYTGNCNIKK